MLETGLRLQKTGAQNMRLSADSGGYRVTGEVRVLFAAPPFFHSPAIQSHEKPKVGRKPSADSGLIPATRLRLQRCGAYCLALLLLAGGQ